MNMLVYTKKAWFRKGIVKIALLKATAKMPISK